LPAKDSKAVDKPWKIKVSKNVHRMATPSQKLHRF